MSKIPVGLPECIKSLKDFRQDQLAFWAGGRFVPFFCGNFSMGFFQKVALMVNCSWLCWCAAHLVPDFLASLVLRSCFRASRGNGNRILKTPFFQQRAWGKPAWGSAPPASTPGHAGRGWGGHPQGEREQIWFSTASGKSQVCFMPVAETNRVK